MHFSDLQHSAERLGELEVIFGDLSREPDSQHWKVGVSIDEQELYQGKSLIFVSPSEVLTLRALGPGKMLQVV